MTACQVDASKMEAFVDHFVSGLGLEGSYSMIVINPTWHVDEPVYGYRMGVSAEELQVLKGQADRLRTVMVGHGPRKGRTARAGSATGWQAGGPAVDVWVGGCVVRSHACKCGAFMGACRVLVKRAARDRRLPASPPPPAGRHPQPRAGAAGPLPLQQLERTRLAARQQRGGQVRAEGCHVGQVSASGLHNPPTPPFTKVFNRSVFHRRLTPELDLFPEV